MKYKFGLIGHSISYSISKIVHQSIGEAVNKDISFDILDVNEDELQSLISRLKSGEFQGFNVTKPYKQSFFDYIDVLSDVAKEIGAINTLYVKDGLVYGDNTDIYGFEYMLDYYHVHLKGKNVLILGTGGASRAVKYVCEKHGAKCQYASRKKTRVMDAKVISYDDINPDLLDIYINATPIGTFPQVNESVLNQQQVTNQIVLDLIYRPKTTKTMSYAKIAYNGYIMLLAQAIKSEILWIGLDIDIHEVLDKIKEVISYE